MRTIRTLMSALLALAIILPLTSQSVGCAGAQAEAEAAIEQSDFHYQLAVGHYQAREVPQAIGELEISLALDPNNARALFMMAFIFQGRRDYDRAIGYYEQALVARPNWHEAMNNLGTTYLQTSRWEEAVEVYEELTSFPTYSTPGHAHNNLGWAYYQLGRTRQALEQFTLALMFQPEHCLAWNNQGIVHQDLGNIQESRRSFEQAVSQCANYAEPRYRLGSLLLALPQPDLSRVQTLFQECFDLEPLGAFGRRCEEYLEMMD